MARTSPGPATVHVPAAPGKFSWAPPNVRHLFRRAAFGLCPHGVRLLRLGDIIWAGTCGNACPGPDAEASGTAIWCALGHHLEVPGHVEAVAERVFLDFLASAVPTTRGQVLRAVPRKQVYLMETIGVYDWRTARVGDVWAAVGFVLDLPVCAIAPNRTCERVLAPSGGAS